MKGRKEEGAGVYSKPHQSGFSLPTLGGGGGGSCPMPLFEIFQISVAASLTHFPQEVPSFSMRLSPTPRRLGPEPGLIVLLESPFNSSLALIAPPLAQRQKTTTVGQTIACRCLWGGGGGHPAPKRFWGFFWRAQFSLQAGGGYYLHPPKSHPQNPQVVRTNTPEA